MCICLFSGVGITNGIKGTIGAYEGQTFTGKYTYTRQDANASVINNFTVSGLGTGNAVTVYQMLAH